MTKHLLSSIIFLNATIIFGQTNYEPQILILSPNLTRYDKVFEKEISNTTKELKKNLKASEQENVNTSDFSRQPENVQMIIKSEIEYSKNLDFFKQLSFLSEQYLAYRFFEKFPGLMIKLNEGKSNGTLSDLKRYSDSENLQYVLNFSSVEIFKVNNTSHARIAVQLYDNLSGSILLDRSYTGDWTNPGFEFTCKDRSLNCTLSNASSNALKDVINIIASNSPTLKKEKQLQQERYDVLVSRYLKQPFDPQSLKSIISPSDSTVNVDIAYQVLFSNDHKKFVAFFLEQVTAQDFKELREKKKDKNINIVSGKDVKDKGFLDKIPQTYAYIVKGVYYNDRWYYEKSNVTYFEAGDLETGKEKYFNNLQKWNFFKPNSAAFAPEFWEMHIFARIESSVEKNKKEIDELKLSMSEAKSKEEKEDYQDKIDDYYEKDLKNGDYIGMPVIVANALQKEKRKQDEIFADEIRNKILDDFYQSRSGKNGIKGFVKMNGSNYALLFPSDRSVLLSPVVADYGNGKMELHYYVLIPGDNKGYDIYYWNYFKPIKPKYNANYGQEINAQLNEITMWNFSFDTLNDREFWTRYVLIKEDGNYKYLTKVQ